MLLLESMLKVKMMTTTTVEEVIKTLVHTTMLLTLSLFVLSYAFCTLLVKNTSLFRVAENIVSIRYILKSCLSAFWIVRVFVGMVLYR